MLNYLIINDPAQKLALNIEKQTVIFSTNLLMYVFFGFELIVLSLALYDRMKSGAPALMQVGTAVGSIRAGSLIGSSMAAANARPRLWSRSTPKTRFGGVDLSGD